MECFQPFFVYQQVLNKLIADELKNSDRDINTAPIDREESPKILSQYLSEVIEKGLQKIKDYKKSENLHFEKQKCDIFFITLNKAEKDYSPTTMYEDYSINDELFHWQSQSTISGNSPTGTRYINHKSMNSKILLFVREFNKDLAGTAPYTFLGLANYVSHTGSKPMSVTWKLHRPIPAKYLKKTNKLMVG